MPPGTDITQIGLQLGQQLRHRIKVGALAAVRVFTQVVEDDTDHFLRRVDHRDAAVLELAGVLGFEQQIQAVQWYAGQTLFQRLASETHADRAPGVRQAVLITGVGTGEFAQQRRVEVRQMRQLRAIQRLHGFGLNRPGQAAGSRKDHVITAAAGEQFAVQGFGTVEDVVFDRDPGFVLEALQRLLRQVGGPAVEVQGFLFGLGGEGATQQ